jgi:hypothetical protein
MVVYDNPKGELKVICNTFPHLPGGLSPSLEEAIGNAKLIKKAVNSYEKLLNAVRLADKVITLCQQAYHKEAVEAIQAALKEEVE